MHGGVSERTPLQAQVPMALSKARCHFSFLPSPTCLPTAIRSPQLLPRRLRGCRPPGPEAGASASPGTQVPRDARHAPALSRFSGTRLRKSCLEAALGVTRRELWRSRRGGHPRAPSVGRNHPVQPAVRQSPGVPGRVPSPFSQAIRSGRFLTEQKRWQMDAWPVGAGGHRGTVWRASW